MSSSISPSGETLYFAAHERGLGSYDLYSATRDLDGSFGNVTNLGPGINTARMEAGPSISAGELTIYYVDKTDAGVGQGPRKDHGS